MKDLFVGKGPEVVCQEVLSYFGGISATEARPMEGIDRCHGGLPEYDVARTTELLEAAKKTDS